MQDVAIRVDGLSKRYEIGALQQRHDTLRDHIVAGVRGLVRRPGRHAAASTEFWALKDVSLEVGPGEVLGLIGRNGAGKSTLLKVLSRITVPTTGRAEIYGRLGSLLEVGTGFNPELSGRENVYLNGAIMGMRWKEIDRKFDEIVEFAGIGPFIDTPVKRYSSGMYVRLAFAVAAHLEPEILIVDEVLAVGDAMFQKKCLGKMGDVARQGRTVLFVSHNMAAIQNLCTTGIVLADGRIVFRGSAVDASEHYLSSVTSRNFGLADLAAHPGRTNDSTPIVRSIGLLSPDGQSRYTDHIAAGDDLVFEITYDTGDLVLDNAVLGVQSSLGERVFTVGARYSPDFTWRMRGKGTLRCRVPNVPIAAGEYNVMVAMGSRLQRRDFDTVEHALTFRVESSDFFGTGESLLPGQGYFAVRSEWRNVEVADPVDTLAGA
jgi:lipopolysaccharide transport system ATP-binding protein